MSAPTVLSDLDAVELGEILEFLVSWIGSAPEIADSLHRHCGGYSVTELRADFVYFAVLLGADPALAGEEAQR